MAGQIGQVLNAAGVFQIIQTVQRFHQRHHIDGLAGLDLALHHRIDQLVFVAVEIFRLQHFGSVIPGTVVLHQTTQHGLLGFNGMRRHLEFVQCRDRALSPAAATAHTRWRAAFLIAALIQGVRHVLLCPVDACAVYDPA